jgi:hypothetical protein
VKLSDCEVRWLVTRLNKPMQAWSNGGAHHCSDGPLPTLPGVAWSKFYQASRQRALDMHLLSDGGTIVLIQANPGDVDDPLLPPSGFDVVLRKFSADGEPAWGYRLEGPGNHLFLCWDTDAAGNTSVVTDEYDLSGTSEKTAIHRIGPGGTLLGVVRQPFIRDSKACAIDPAGNVYFVTNGDVRAVSKQDPTGKLLWQKPFSISSELGEYPWLTVDATPPGVLIQSSEDSPARGELTRVLEDGTVSWTKLVRGTGLLHGIRRAPDGSLLGIGSIEDTLRLGADSTPLPRPNEWFSVLLSLAEDGNSKSLSFFDGTSFWGPAFAPGSGGSLYVFVGGQAMPIRGTLGGSLGSNVGRPYAFGSSPGAAQLTHAVVKLDASGNFVWSRDLTPLIAAWAGDSSQFLGVGIEARADRVVIAAATSSGPFLAKLDP